MNSWLDEAGAWFSRAGVSIVVAVMCLFSFVLRCLKRDICACDTERKAETANFDEAKAADFAC